MDSFADRFLRKFGSAAAAGSRPWVTYYAALVIVIVAAKLHGLRSYEDVWRESPVYAAAAAVVSSSLEILVAAIVAVCFALGWQFATSRIAKAAIWAAAVAAAFFIAAINLVNSEMIPGFGLPLSLTLVQLSDVLGSGHGRSAVLGWVSDEGWALAVLVLVSPLLAIAAAALVYKVLRPMPVLVLAFAFTAATVAAGAVFEPTAEPFARSGTVHFGRSVIRSGDRLFGPEVTAVTPLPATRTEPAVSFAGAGDLAQFKNVILIILESVSASHLDQYGGTNGVTRRLAARADQAVVISDAYAHTVSSNRSLAAIFSGLYPPVNGGKLPVGGGTSASLPHLLGQAGIRTGFFHSSDTRFDDAGRYLSRIGFDTVRDFRGRACSEALLDDGWGALATPDRCTFDQLRGWIASAPDERFFAALWTFQTHYPYYAAPVGGHEPGPGAEEARYLAAIAEADRLIDQLVEWLIARGIYDETLIVITSDHGERLDRRAGAGLRDLSEAGVRVPLILLNPQLASDPSLKRLSGHIDVAPTIADALGVEPPPSWDGLSIFRPQTERPIFFANAWGELALGYRFRNLKVVHQVESATTQVFDLSQNPRERRDLSSRLPKQAIEQEQSRLLGWARSLGSD